MKKFQVTDSRGHEYDIDADTAAVFGDTLMFYVGEQLTSAFPKFVSFFEGANMYDDSTAKSSAGSEDDTNGENNNG